MSEQKEMLKIVEDLKTEKKKEISKVLEICLNGFGHVSSTLNDVLLQIIAKSKEKQNLDNESKKFQSKGKKSGSKAQKFSLEVFQMGDHTWSHADVVRYASYYNEQLARWTEYSRILKIVKGPSRKQPVTVLHVPKFTENKKGEKVETPFFKILADYLPKYGQEMNLGDSWSRFVESFKEHGDIPKTLLNSVLHKLFPSISLDASTLDANNPNVPDFAKSVSKAGVKVNHKYHGFKESEHKNVIKLFKKFLAFHNAEDSKDEHSDHEKAKVMFQTTSGDDTLVWIPVQTRIGSLIAMYTDKETTHKPADFTSVLESHVQSREASGKSRRKVLTAREDKMLVFLNDLYLVGLARQSDKKKSQKKSSPKKSPKKSPKHSPKKSPKHSPVKEQAQVHSKKNKK